MRAVTEHTRHRPCLCVGTSIARPAFGTNATGDGGGVVCTVKKAVIYMEKRKRNKKTMIVLLILLGAVLVFACVKIAEILTERETDIEEFNQLAALIEPVRPSDVGMATDSALSVPVPTVSLPIASAPVDVERTEPAATEAAPVETAPKPVFTRNLQPLFDRNPDCIGWVYISDTSINYPVVHTPQEAEKYLRKNFDGAYSRSGVPFLQANQTLDSDNLIIYGHNMQNGTMFSDLTKYRSQAFCTAHPTIEFETARGLWCYSVFAVAQIRNSNPWYQFVDADDEAAFSAQLAAITKSALYTTGTPPLFGQQLLTLSTCYGSSKDDRLIVIAVRIPA